MAQEQSTKKANPWLFIMGVVLVIAGVFLKTTWVWVLGLVFIFLPIAFILSFLFIGIIGVATFAFLESHNDKKNRRY